MIQEDLWDKELGVVGPVMFKKELASLIAMEKAEYIDKIILPKFKGEEREEELQIRDTFQNLTDHMVKVIDSLDNPMSVNIALCPLKLTAGNMFTNKRYKQLIQSVDEHIFTMIDEKLVKSTGAKSDYMRALSHTYK